MAITTLRAVVGDMNLDDVLSKREQMNAIMQARMDEVTDRWGVKVNAVEIREILPPRDIQEAMSRQMSAERFRRATVTEAEGSREAAVTIANGNRDAAILNAEGEKQSAILNAEGNRQAAILNAEGFSIALDRIYQSASRVDEKTMALQYLDMMRSLAGEPVDEVGGADGAHELRVELCPQHDVRGVATIERRRSYGGSIGHEYARRASSGCAQQPSDGREGRRPARDAVTQRRSLPLLGVDGVLVDQVDITVLDDPLDYVAYDIAAAVRDALEETAPVQATMLSTLVAELRLCGLISPTLTSSISSNG